jgi:hypothetical protein
MEGEEGGGVRLSKRFNDDKGGGEVDYKTKSGTAWSHNFLNQKPWHPLSYPNQVRLGAIIRYIHTYISIPVHTNFCMICVSVSTEIKAKRHHRQRSSSICYTRS